MRLEIKKRLKPIVKFKDQKSEVIKMVGVLIAAHGGFADGLLSAAELLVGKQKQISTIGLYHGDSIESFEERVLTMLSDLDDGDGVLVFVDIFGGSPSNVIVKAISAGRKIKAIDGVNMAMMVQTVIQRESSTLDELCQSCYEIGCMRPALLHEKCEEMMQNNETDDNDDF